MPKQHFNVIDYFGPLAVGIIFIILLLIISFFIINFYLITPKDDLTKFELLGSKANLRLGVHKMSTIKRGGYASTYAQEHPDDI
uniref:Uncharacterized protein n=1 Tax=Acrobeloides nanus TaxID=290746 RepID=A0A914C0Q6_9BILA